MVRYTVGTDIQGNTAYASVAKSMNDRQSKIVYYGPAEDVPWILVFKLHFWNYFGQVLVNVEKNTEG